MYKLHFWKDHELYLKATLKYSTKESSIEIERLQNQKSKRRNLFYTILRAEEAEVRVRTQEQQNEGYS